MMHPQAGLDASATWDLARLLFHDRRWPFAFRQIGNGEFPAQVKWLDFHLTGWFEFIESGAPYRMKLGTIGRKRFL